MRWPGRRMRVVAVGLACVLAAPAVSAQADDPFAYDPAEDAAVSSSWFASLLLRGDWARDLPQNLPDEQRGMARLRMGMQWLPGGGWELGAAVEASQGSDSAQVVRLAHDNHRTNDLNVDLLYARRRFGEHGMVMAGASASTAWSWPARRRCRSS